MEKITIKELYKKQNNKRTNDGVLCKFVLKKDGYIMWLCRKSIGSNAFYFVMLPCLFCNIIMAATMLTEDELTDFINDRAVENNEKFDGNHVYTIAE